MMWSGLLLMGAGAWVIAQVTLGSALDRLGITGQEVDE